MPQGAENFPWEAMDGELRDFVVTGLQKRKPVWLVRCRGVAVEQRCVAATRQAGTTRGRRRQTRQRRPIRPVLPPQPVCKTHDFHVFPRVFPLQKINGKLTGKGEIMEGPWYEPEGPGWANLPDTEPLPRLPGGQLIDYTNILVKEEWDPTHLPVRGGNQETRERNPASPPPEPVGAGLGCALAAPAHAQRERLRQSVTN